LQFLSFAELSIAAMIQAAIVAALAFATVTEADTVVFFMYSYECLILHLQFIKILSDTQNSV
jgi:hypothetical protein